MKRSLSSTGDNSLQGIRLHLRMPQNVSPMSPDKLGRSYPAYVKYPGAVVGSVLFLWAFLWIVAKALGA